MAFWASVERLILLPPRLEVPITHSLPSRLHRTHGGTGVPSAESLASAVSITPGNARPSRGIAVANLQSAFALSLTAHETRLTRSL